MIRWNKLYLGSKFWTVMLLFDVKAIFVDVFFIFDEGCKYFKTFDSCHIGLQ